VIECWVADNGAGVPAALLDKVFDRGETDQHNAGGTGLGLAIVAMFTEAHGGQASVDSTEGVGATFRFTLPAKAKVDAEKAAVNAKTDVSE
jgi:signal transduction histidine kinase